MTPKEKAQELCKKYEVELFNGNSDFSYDVKKCALVCVDEIINSYNNIYDDFISGTEFGNYSNMKKYWMDVKKEIELL